MDCRLVNASSGLDEMYMLREGETKVGRDSSNDIQLTAPNVSRNHATLTNMPSVCQIEDLGSANGTYINGDKIKSMILKNNDEIRFADQMFRFETIGSVGADDVTMTQRDYSPRAQMDTVRIQQRTHEETRMMPVVSKFQPLKPKK